MEYGGKLFLRPRECYFGVYFPCSEIRSNDGNKHQTITRVRVQNRFVATVHTFCYFLYDIMSQQMVKKYDLHTSTPWVTHCVYVLVMMSQSIVQCIMGPGNCLTSAFSDMTCVTRSVYVLVMTSQSILQCIMGPSNCLASTFSDMIKKECAWVLRDTLATYSPNICQALGKNIAARAPFFEL